MKQLMIMKIYDSVVIIIILLTTATIKIIVTYSNSTVATWSLGVRLENIRYFFYSKILPPIKFMIL